MRKGLTFTSSGNIKYTYDVPHFDSLLSAQQYLINVAVLIASECARGINTGLTAETTLNNVKSIIPNDVAGVVCQNYRNYCNSNKTCSIYTSLWNFTTYKTNNFNLPAGDYYTFDTNTINVAENNSDSAFFGNYIGDTTSTPSMHIYSNITFSCESFQGTCALSGWQQNGFLKLMLPCTYYLTDNTLVFAILNITANGTFGWFDNTSWQCKPYQGDYYASKINHLAYPILPPRPEEPTISGNPTADIDTETGESETQDSEDNVGGAGNVTLINNIVNYDNYSPNYARVDTGFITPFEVDPTNLNTLHSFLYSETILDLIKNYFAGDATKAIVDLFNIPIAPAVEPTSTEIKVGIVPTGAMGNVLSSETATFNFGSIDITQGYNSNSFMDLDPYNKYMIFLPFIGFKTLNTNDIRSINDTGFKIYLKYIVDMLTGDFVAVIEADHNNAVFDNDTGTLTTAKLTKQVINTFSGNMRTAIPLNSINSREAITPALGALATAIAGASTGNPLVMAQSVGSSLNSMANYNNALIPRGDSLSGNIGNLTINKAFVINQESPKYIRTGKSNQLVGYPVYKYMKITKDRGYVKVKDLIMSGFTGTAKEAEALEALLKGGVWTQ